MRRADLRRVFVLVTASYGLWFLIGVSTFMADNIINQGEKTLLTPGGHIHQYQFFELYTALSLVVVAMPASWLAWALQRRAAFLADLRSAWPGVVSTMQRTMEYLRRTDGDIDEYEATLTALRARIDDAHALFPRTTADVKPPGTYPYESFAHIHNLFQGFGYHEFLPEEQASQVRAEVIKTWQKVRGQIIHEFDSADLDRS